MLVCLAISRRVVGVLPYTNDVLRLNCDMPDPVHTHALAVFRPAVV